MDRKVYCKFCKFCKTPIFRRKYPRDICKFKRKIKTTWYEPRNKIISYRPYCAFINRFNNCPDFCDKIKLKFRIINFVHKAFDELKKDKK